MQSQISRMVSYLILRLFPWTVRKENTFQLLGRTSGRSGVLLPRMHSSEIWARISCLGYVWWAAWEMEVKPPRRVWDTDKEAVDDTVSAQSSYKRALKRCYSSSWRVLDPHLREKPGWHAVCAQGSSLSPERRHKLSRHEGWTKPTQDRSNHCLKENHPRELEISSANQIEEFFFFNVLTRVCDSMDQHYFTAVDSDPQFWGWDKGRAKLKPLTKGGISLLTSSSALCISLT